MPQPAELAQLASAAGMETHHIAVVAWATLLARMTAEPVAVVSLAWSRDTTAPAPAWTLALEGERIASATARLAAALDSAPATTPEANAAFASDAAPLAGYVREAADMPSCPLVLQLIGDDVLLHDGDGGYTAAQLHQWLSYWKCLLGSLAAAPEALLSDAAIVPAQAAGGLLAFGNDMARPFPLVSGVHRLFEAQAARTPDAVAVVQACRLAAEQAARSSSGCSESLMAQL